MSPSRAVHHYQWKANQKPGGVAQSSECQPHHGSCKETKRNQLAVQSIDSTLKEVIQAVSSTTSTKATDDDISGFQSYTIRTLDKKLTTSSDIESTKC